MGSHVVRLTLAWLSVILALPAGALWAGALPAVASPAAPGRWLESGGGTTGVGATAIRERRFELVMGGERVALHRYAQEGAPAVRVLLYLPGTNMNGAAALTDERHNLWLYLAARGVTVYALDYRSHFIAPDAAAEGRDFTPLAAWTTAVYVDDAVQALAFIHAQLPRARVFVAGFSRGVTLAYGLVCRAPAGQIAGLVALDGGFKRAPGSPGFGPAAGGAAPAEPYAAARARFLAAGRFADDVGGGIGWANRQSLMRAAIGGDARARAALGRVLTNAWGAGRLANPGAISDVAVLARLMIDYDRFYPAAQNIDGDAIARVADAPDTPVDDCWGHMTLPVLFVESEKFGAALGMVSYSATRSGSKDVTGITAPGFGHLDVLVGERAVALVYEPTLQWLRSH